MKRPAKLELNNGERFLTAPDVSYFTDDTTLIVGELVDLDDYEIVPQHFCPHTEVWIDFTGWLEYDNFTSKGWTTRQVARKKAVAETDPNGYTVLGHYEYDLKAGTEKYTPVDLEAVNKGKDPDKSFALLKGCLGTIPAVELEGKEPEAMTEQDPIIKLAKTCLFLGRRGYLNTASDEACWEDFMSRSENIKLLAYALADSKKK